MALVTHQVQGSYAPSRLLSGRRGIESNSFLAAFQTAKRTDIILLKHKSRLCVTTPLIHGPKRKSFRISSFKSNVQNDESGDRTNRSKYVKKPVNLSYVSRDHEETLSESANVQNVQAPSTFDANETAWSSSIQNLFKSWLTLLRSPSLNQAADETLEEPSSDGTVEAEHKIQNRGNGVILKTLWQHFLGLNPTIIIPAMIFIPMYLSVTMKYGAEVAKELTPLWIAGPLLVALYIKTVQRLCSLYVFCFKQSVKTVKNLPTFCLVTYNYVASGNLKENIRLRYWEPVVEIWHLGPTGVWKRVWKRYQAELYDKYLDYIESIWPRYCKLIRFLKTANLI